MDIALDIFSMQNMEIDDKEFILEYVQRWFGDYLSASSTASKRDSQLVYLHF